jgi:Cu+-exporting ATPase
MATQESTVNLRITGMTCASCVRRVERALGKVEGVDTAAVNFATETAQVTLGAPVEFERLVAAVQKAGYQAAEASTEDGRASSDRKSFWLLVISAAIGAPTVVIAMAMDIAGMALFGNHQFTGWLLLGLATPIQFGLGWRFYRGAWTSLRHLNPNMDVLVALGTTVAYVFSAWVVVANESRHMFFDVSTAVLVFISLGKYFEEHAKREANAALRALSNLGARNATILRHGAEVEVAADSLMPDDILVVRPGERLAADGLIVSGRGAIDESMITGESIPAERRAGDALLGGTVNQDGLLQVRVTAVGAHSALARLSRMVEDAQGSKAPIQRLVDQVAAIFVPVVIVIALGVFLGWGLAGGSWTDAMVYAVAVLVVACPCALGLATPTAIMVGTGLGAERGILIRKAEVLERIRKLDVIVLDKTGTLTQGRPQVVGTVAFDDWTPAEILRLAAAAEAGSSHPLSRAIVDAATDAGMEAPVATGFRSLVARGVAATVDGHEVLAGNAALLDSERIPTALAAAAITRMEAAGQTAIHVAIDGHLAGVIGIFDEVKPGAARAVSALKGLGLRVIMMTGDNERAALAVASAAGISEVHAGALPEGKLALIERLQGEGLHVAMVGDGINDAPALAKADLGIAMSTGTDAAIEASDITLLHGDVSRLAEAILLGRSTLGAIRQNLGWAFGYNVLAIPVAAAGLLNPVIAGAAMALSSISVMGNSLRLRSKAPAIARQAGNAYSAPRFSFLDANRGPLLALAGATAIVVAPLVIFTGIDRGWFGNETDEQASHGGEHTASDGHSASEGHSGWGSGGHDNPFRR